jgi:hypothetical protein
VGLDSGTADGQIAQLRGHWAYYTVASLRGRRTSTTTGRLCAVIEGLARIGRAIGAAAAFACSARFCRPFSSSARCCSTDSRLALRRSARSHRTSLGERLRFARDGTGDGAVEVAPHCAVLHQRHQVAVLSRPQEQRVRDFFRGQPAGHALSQRLSNADRQRRRLAGGLP